MNRRTINYDVILGESKDIKKKSDHGLQRTKLSFNHIRGIYSQLIR